MPADVAVRPAPSAHLLGGVERGVNSSPPAETLYPWTAEECSGRLTLLGPAGPPQEVLARVYRTSLEHFAVLYPGHRNVTRPLGVLNLRNTRVEPLEEKGGRGFTVRQRAPDAPHALTFLLPPQSPITKEEWLVAFTWRGSPTLHATPLPVLQEDAEEC